MIKHWDKGPTNKGKLFSIYLLDREERDIRATFFQEAVDRYFNMLEVGQVYNFSNGQVRLANKYFNNSDCDYELTFTESAEIVPVRDGTVEGEIKKMSVKPTKISRITPHIPSVVDVCGIVVNFGEIETFISRAGNEITKLELFLADESNATIKCTVFGEKCSQVKEAIQRSHASSTPAVCAIKGAKISDYKGCSLSMLRSSEIYINPEIKEKAKLLNWLKTGVDFKNLDSKSSLRTRRSFKSEIHERKTCEEVDDLELLQGVSEYAVIKATISVIRKENIIYTACPEEGNNKKVIDQGSGSYFCESNGKTYTHCEHRYTMNMFVIDESGGLWLTAFNGEADKITGVSASELYQVLEEGDIHRFEKIIFNAKFPEFLFTVRINSEMYNNVKTKRYDVVDVEIVDSVTESKNLLQEISKMDEEEKNMLGCPPVSA